VGCSKESRTGNHVLTAHEKRLDLCLARRAQAGRVAINGQMRARLATPEWPRLAVRLGRR
jgi:hypothetical protein